MNTYEDNNFCVPCGPEARSPPASTSFSACQCSASTTTVMATPTSMPTSMPLTKEIIYQNQTVEVIKVVEVEKIVEKVVEVEVPCRRRPAAPTNTRHFVKVTTVMPYSLVDFDADKRQKYKTAIAVAAGTIPENVDIVSVTENRRRAGGIKVETKIRATDAASLNVLVSSIGSGDTLVSNVNSALKAQGLEQSTAVSDVTTGTENKPSANAGANQIPKDESTSSEKGSSVIVVVIGCASAACTLSLGLLIHFCHRKRKVVQISPVHTVDSNETVIAVASMTLASTHAATTAPHTAAATHHQTEVDSWLTEMGLEARIRDFRDENIDVEALSKMDHEQLQSLGITKLGDRLKLLSRAQENHHVRVVPS